MFCTKLLCRKSEMMVNNTLYFVPPVANLGLTLFKPFNNKADIQLVSWFNQSTGPRDEWIYIQRSRLVCLRPNLGLI